MQVPTRKKRLLRQREQEILDAAAILFSQADWRAVTADQIATRAGIGKGTIYLHFRTKDEIVARLILRHVKRLLGQWGRGPDSQEAGDPWRKLVFSTWRLAMEHPEEARLMPLLLETWFHNCLPDETRSELSAARDTLMRTTASLVQRSPPSGEPPAPEDRARAWMVWASLSALLHGSAPAEVKVLSESAQLIPFAAEFLRAAWSGSTGVQRMS
jgi:AcrR family transcriptional regulator